MTPDTFSSSPAYFRLQQELALKINAGQWKPGEQLPPERTLAKEYSLSVGTVRKAMEKLVQAGYCYRVQGKGTFVTDYPTDRAVFYRMRTSFAGRDAVLIPFNISRTETSAAQETASALNLAAGAPCIRICRCLNGRDEKGQFTLGWTSSCFSLPMCSGLMRTPMADFQKYSLYHLAERDCRIPSFFCDEILHLCMGLPPEIHAALGLREHAPCFEMHMISYTYGNIPFEYRISYVLGGQRGLMRKHDFRL